MNVKAWFDGTFIRAGLPEGYTVIEEFLENASSNEVSYNDLCDKLKAVKNDKVTENFHGSNGVIACIRKNEVHIYNSIMEDMRKKGQTCLDTPEDEFSCKVEFECFVEIVKKWWIAINEFKNDSEK